MKKNGFISEAWHRLCIGEKFACEAIAFSYLYLFAQIIRAILD